MRRTIGKAGIQVQKLKESAPAGCERCRQPSRDRLEKKNGPGVKKYEKGNPSKFIAAEEKSFLSPEKKRNTFFSRDDCGKKGIRPGTLGHEKCRQAARPHWLVVSHDTMAGGSSMRWRGRSTRMTRGGVPKEAMGAARRTKDQRRENNAFPAHAKTEKSRRHKNAESGRRYRYRCGDRCFLL